MFGASRVVGNWKGNPRKENYKGKNHKNLQKENFQCLQVVTDFWTNMQRAEPLGFQQKAAAVQG